MYMYLSKKKCNVYVITQHDLMQQRTRGTTEPAPCLLGCERDDDSDDNKQGECANSTVILCISVCLQVPVRLGMALPFPS